MSSNNEDIDDQAVEVEDTEDSEVEELEFIDHVSSGHLTSSSLTPFPSCRWCSSSAPRRWAAGWRRAGDWWSATERGSPRSTTTSRTGRASWTGCGRTASWRWRGGTIRPWSSFSWAVTKVRWSHLSFDIESYIFPSRVPESSGPGRDGEYAGEYRRVESTNSCDYSGAAYFSETP